MLCGDNHTKAVLRSKSNINISCLKSKVDLTQWSVSYLPLLNSSIDIVVTDMVSINIIFFLHYYV